MVRLRKRRAPESHNGIADIFVERAPALEQDIRHCAQIFVQQAHEFIRRKPFGNSRERAYVAEHDRQLLRLTTSLEVLARIFFEQCNYTGRDVTLEGATNSPFLALLEDHTEASDGSVVHGESSGRDHEV